MIHWLYRLKRRIKYAWQKLRWGYDESDMWNLDYTIAVFIAPRLKCFRENFDSSPPNSITIDEWRNIIDKMIYSFECVIEDVNGLKRYNHQRQDSIEEGLFLFAKYFQHLWN